MNNPAEPVVLDVIEREVPLVIHFHFRISEIFAENHMPVHDAGFPENFRDFGGI